jgi:phosphoribosylamine-glycine ligase
VATFVGVGADHAEARNLAYSAIGQAVLEGGQHRSDIAAELSDA